MIALDVDTALSEVPVNVAPLTDDTDFKSTEEAVAFNAAGMDLEWHFVSSAGAYTVTAVTPTSGGTYDWTHQGNGMYSIEIPASGGASINNDTEGYGYFVGKATGVLPWRGPTICFRAAGINDKLVDSAWDEHRGLAGSALPDASPGTADGLVRVSDFEARTLVAAAYATAANQVTIASYIDTEIGTLLSNVATILGHVDTEIASLLTAVADVPTVAELEARTLVRAEYATASNQVTLQTIATALQKLARADRKIDKTTNALHWDEVLLEEGTANELLRRELFDVDATPLAAINTVVGQAIKPAP